MARVIDTARNSRLILAGLILGHLVVISRQVDAGGGSSLLEKIVFGLLSPFQRLAGGAVRGVGDAYHGYVALWHVGEENRELKQRVDALETALARRQQQAQEAERLRELLGLRQALPTTSVAAEVVARDGLPWFRTLTLDKGSRHGVALNAPVVSPTGVVGRVVALGTEAAKVQLLLDRDSGVGALIERSRVAGVASGQVGFGDSATADLIMKYVPAVADVVEGDVVVTSGMDRVYPKGLVVGRVRGLGAPSGLFREVLVTPSAQFDRIERVLVLPPWDASANVISDSVRPQDLPK